MPDRQIWYGVGACLVLVGLAFAVALVPGAPPQVAGQVEMVNGSYYDYESQSLFGNQSWLNYSFHGVVFGFHLWCAITVDVGTVCGNATEPSGVSYPYSFQDGLPQTDPPWQTWVAPDGHEAVQYQEGGHVHLLVSV
jgi:hypothetical protein